MKKFFKYGLLVIVAIVLIMVLLYVFFPKSLFNLAVNAQRRSAGLVKKEVQVDDHKLVYLEG